MKSNFEFVLFLLVGWPFVLLGYFMELVLAAVKVGRAAYGADSFGEFIDRLKFL